MEIKFCRKCGKSLRPSAKFCNFCGLEISSGQEPDNREIKKYSHTLCFREGKMQDSVFELLEASNTLGRGNADIYIEDPKISKKHAVIEIKEDKAYIRDMESSNGTFVNNRRISESLLEDGDKIRIGNTIFEYRGSSRHVRGDIKTDDTILESNEGFSECPVCQGIIKEGEECPKCGAKVSDIREEFIPPVELPEIIHLLKVLSGEDKDKVFTLDKVQNIIGAGNTDIVLRDPEISMEHAMIEIKKDCVILRDLKSEKGVFLYDIKLSEGKITSGDIIRLGETELIYKAVQKERDTSGPIEVKEEKKAKDTSTTEIKQVSPKCSLLVLSGNDKDQCFYIIKEKTTIGRKDADIIVNDPMASGRHAEIEVSDNNIILRDTGSSNGVFINDSRISEMTLSNKDKILIGQTLMKFIIEDEDRDDNDPDSTIDIQNMDADA